MISFKNDKIYDFGFPVATLIEVDSIDKFGIEELNKVLEIHEKNQSFTLEELKQIVSALEKYNAP